MRTENDEDGQVTVRWPGRAAKDKKQTDMEDMGINGLAGARTVYVCGTTREGNAEAAADLERRGFSVQDPLAGATPEPPALRIIRLLACDGAYFTRDWIASGQCLLERKVAERTGKRIAVQRGGMSVDVDVVEAVTGATSVSWEEMRSHGRFRQAVYARMIYARMMMDSGATVTEIGAQLNRHHSTVIHWLHSFESDIRYTREFQALYSSTVSRYEAAKSNEGGKEDGQD